MILAISLGPSEAGCYPLSETAGDAGFGEGYSKE